MNATEKELVKEVCQLITIDKYRNLLLLLRIITAVLVTIRTNVCFQGLEQMAVKVSDSSFGLPTLKI